LLLLADIGNTNIEIGIMNDKKGDLTVVQSYRYYTRANTTEDEFGFFLLNIVMLAGYKKDDINLLIFSSVVPPMNSVIQKSFIKYFNKPVYEVNHLTPLPIKNCYSNPEEVGADRLVNAAAVNQLYKNRNAIIIDMGTATTICALTSEGDYLGGIIIPGIRTSSDALTARAARLPAINISKKSQILQKGTTGAIESGIYYSTLFGLKGSVDKMIEELNFNESLIVGTGGYMTLFKDEKLADIIDDELSIKGLKIIADTL